MLDPRKEVAEPQDEAVGVADLAISDHNNEEVG
jgi:hypothetical protein